MAQVPENVSVGEVERPSARLRRRASTIDELLGHAERLASEEGLEALTMHRLAALHGVRVAALYRYWPSKDALLAALLGKVFDRLFSSLADARAAVDGALGAKNAGDDGGAKDADGPPGPAAVRALARLIAASRAYLRFADERPEASALLTRMLAAPRPVVSDETSAPTLLPRVVALAEEVGRDLERAREGGALAEGDDVARAVLLWTSLQGLVAARKMSRFGIGGPVRALEEELVRALFSGWGASAEVLSRATDAAKAAEGTMVGPAPAGRRV